MPLTQAPLIPEIVYVQHTVTPEDESEANGIYELPQDVEVIGMFAPCATPFEYEEVSSLVDNRGGHIAAYNGRDADGSIAVLLNQSPHDPRWWHRTIYRLVGGKVHVEDHIRCCGPNGEARNVERRRSNIENVGWRVAQYSHGLLAFDSGQIVRNDRRDEQ